MKRTTLAFALLVLTACNPNLTPKGFNQSGEGDQPIDLVTQAKTHSILVTDLKGQAIEGAQILFGSRLGQPFVNNMLQTDRAGQVHAPKEWNSPMSVTVDHPGYMRVTYLNISPRSLTFKLRPKEKNMHLELSGTTTGFGSLKQNNVADFGLVLSSLTKRDLFAFSLDKIISTEMDVMEIAGVESTVPSNLTFPRQKESYVIPVTLEKENYRLYYPEAGTKKVYALHGKFPFKEVVDRIRKKTPFPALVNYFEINSGSMRDVLVDGPTQITLPVNEMAFTAEDHITPPEIDGDKVMLSISLFERQGYLYPTDLHKVENTMPFALKGLDKAQRLFLSMLIRSADFYAKQKPTQEAVSAELVKQTHNHSPQFLSLINQPSPTNNGWTTQIPTLPDSVLPLTTYSVLSRVINNGKQKTILRDWEFFAEQWINSLDIPEWPAQAQHQAAWIDNEPENDNNTAMGGAVTNEVRRWEVTYIGTNQKLPLPSAARLGPDIIDYSSHISFNSIEF